MNKNLVLPFVTLFEEWASHTGLDAGGSILFLWEVGNALCGPIQVGQMEQEGP